jgi:hypothetical protein
MQAKNSGLSLTLMQGLLQDTCNSDTLRHSPNRMCALVHQHIRTTMKVTYLYTTNIINYFTIMNKLQLQSRHTKIIHWCGYTLWVYQRHDIDPASPGGP